MRGFILTAGQVTDICQAEDLSEGFPFETPLAGKGYDADRFRALVAYSMSGPHFLSARSASSLFVGLSSTQRLGLPPQRAVGQGATIVPPIRAGTDAPDRPLLIGQVYVRKVRYRRLIAARPSGRPTCTRRGRRSSFFRATKL
jgi:hypothetical protein